MFFRLLFDTWPNQWISVIRGWYKIWITAAIWIYQVVRASYRIIERSKYYRQIRLFMFCFMSRQIWFFSFSTGFDITGKLKKVEFGHQTFHSQKQSPLPFLGCVRSWSFLLAFVPHYCDCFVTHFIGHLEIY